MRHYLLIAVAGLALIAGAAASLTPAGFAGAVASPHPPGPAHVDSVFPIEEEIRRFRAAIGAPVATLSGGAESLDSLVGQYLDALQTGDRAALESLVLSVEEYAYLYYPRSRYASKPYEMSPGLLWFQLDAYGQRGLDRAIRRFGGSLLAGDAGYRCPGAPEPLGDGYLWSGCVVELPDAAGGTAAITLFGEILEHRGMFKFVSYGNGL